MKTINLNLGKRSYKIVIGRNILGELAKFVCATALGRDAYIITNKYIKKQYGFKLKVLLNQSSISVRFKVVRDSETSKSFNTLNAVLNDLARYDLRRRIFIVSFGGGVIGDLSGLVASIYKRGIAYVQVPTTLLAQVDSSIGGKTAVDLSTGKNLVGTFYQPRLVVSDTQFLQTLDKRQLRAALAEVIKYGIIQDKKFFAYLEKHLPDILAGKDRVLGFVVEQCSQIKAKIVEIDEREESGHRTKLNFGHTIGHAIESAARYRGYNHGEAVALGMLCSSTISVKLGLLDESILTRIKDLVRNAGVPTKIRKLSISEILKAYYHDKKFKNAKNRFVLICGLGRTKIVENIPLKIIKEVLRQYC